MFHILVVEDDKNTRFLMREILEMEHYTVYTAKNGLEDRLMSSFRFRSWIAIVYCTPIKPIIADIAATKKEDREFTRVMYACGIFEVTKLLVNSNNVRNTTIRAMPPLNRSFFFL